MSALPYALLTDELEKQPKAITHEIECLEESYRALRTLQIQCKDRYVGLEDQIKRAGSNLQLQISDHQTTIVPSRRHPKNVQSFNQTLQDLQNLRPDFDAVSLELADITAKVQVQLHKLNGMKLALGIKPEKSAQERIDELEKKKQWHQNRLKMLPKILKCAGYKTLTLGIKPEKSAEERIDELEKKKQWHQKRGKMLTNYPKVIDVVNEHPLLFTYFYIEIMLGLGAFLVYLFFSRSTHKNMISEINIAIADNTA